MAASERSPDAAVATVNLNEAGMVKAGSWVNFPIDNTAHGNFLRLLDGEIESPVTEPGTLLVMSSSRES
ncbi:MAG: hypothetical protein ACRDEA_05115 [Microcystaceae cyanobacterium]